MYHLIETEELIYRLCSVTYVMVYFCTETDHTLRENYDLAKMTQTTFKMH